VGAVPAQPDVFRLLYIVKREKIKESQLGRSASKAFPSNQHPRQPITTFQALSIDRLHGHLDLSFGNHDSQIVLIPWDRSVGGTWPSGLLIISRLSRYKT
jgi:hypothetical protein